MSDLISKNEVLEIINEEAEKRKDNTFLLWDFPNNIIKRVIELHTDINPSKALQYFKEMVVCSQLDYYDEKPKCDLIFKELEFTERMKHKLERWLDLLQTDGCNSKSIVMNDIQYLLKELKESER